MLSKKIKGYSLIELLLVFAFLMMSAYTTKHAINVVTDKIKSVHEKAIAKIKSEQNNSTELFESKGNE